MIYEAIIYFLSFVFIIAIPIFLHELGHFMAARSVGIRIEKFYIGFNFFGLGLKKKYKDTEYGIGLFPLGGYVKASGILDESLDENIETEKKDYEFRSKNVFQKLWFLSAGVIMNFILSIFIYTCIFYSDGAQEFIDKPIIGGIQDEVMTFDDNQDLIPVKAPAKALGLKKGDEILTINGYKINSWTDIGEIVSINQESLAHITWKRENKFYDGETYILSSPIPQGFSIEKRGVLGIIASSNHMDLTMLQSIEKSVSTTYSIVKGTFYGFIGLISGNLPLKYMTGIVGIANIAGETAQQDQALLNLFLLMAFISANLGLLNILPIPGLDGGHAAIAIIEGVIRRDLPINIKYGIHFIGFILIMFLFVMTIYNDIVGL